MSSSSFQFSRRTLLAGAGGVAAAGLLGVRTAWATDGPQSYTAS
ncbi:twin-arginine translocation signal domain-containing protein [Sphaerisporangium perillae]|nr:twin-arginine translocation signal domain-containing protein [Sphaerisporangium perillae]